MITGNVGTILRSVFNLPSFYVQPHHQKIPRLLKVFGKSSSEQLTHCGRLSSHKVKVYNQLFIGRRL